MSKAEADRQMEAYLTHDVEMLSVLYTPSWTVCEWCMADVSHWHRNANGYAICPECGVVN